MTLAQRGVSRSIAVANSADQVEAEVVHFPAHVGLRKHLYRIAMQQLDDHARRPGRRHQAEPRHGLEPWITATPAVKPTRMRTGCSG
jgi:hypothetical protein